MKRKAGADSERCGCKLCLLGSITHLHLSGQQITQSKVKDIGARLATCSAMTSLCLDWCGISGEESCALSEGVGRSLSLTELDLDANDIGVEGARGLGAALAASRN